MQKQAGPLLTKILSGAKGVAAKGKEMAGKGVAAVKEHPIAAGAVGTAGVGAGVAAKKLHEKQAGKISDAVRKGVKVVKSKPMSEGEFDRFWHKQHVRKEMKLTREGRFNEALDVPDVAGKQAAYEAGVRSVRVKYAGENHVLGNMAGIAPGVAVGAPAGAVAGGASTLLMNAVAKVLSKGRVGMNPAAAGSLGALAGGGAGGIWGGVRGAQAGGNVERILQRQGGNGPRRVL